MAIRDLVPKFGRRTESTPARRGEEDSLLSFQREMNRLFDDFFRGAGFPSLPDWGEDRLAGMTFNPRVDVSETGKEVRVTAELPGLDEKDVTVELGDDVIMLRGEKHEERDENDSNWHRRETTWGSFHRVIPLPSAVDGDKAKAKFKRGKLTVTLPKREESPPRRNSIPIESD